MTMTTILTHRGLEPSKPDFFSESTIEAFQDQLRRGFGLELDLQFARDGIVLVHDADLSRLTLGKDTRKLKDLTVEEACEVLLPKGRLGSFNEVMQLASAYPVQQIAIHFKGSLQTPEKIEVLVQSLERYSDRFEQILLFDLKPETAKVLKNAFPGLRMAASVAHSYDIERYQNAVHGTLISLEEYLDSAGLYQWAWLDEWDLACKNSQGKKFYCQEVFDMLRTHEVKIALVTPELHGTSPGLHGGEAHPDAENPQRLFNRIREILDLQPDAVCTDYPEEVRLMCTGGNLIVSKN